MRGRRWLFVLIAGLALTLLLGRGIARIYTDYLWYASLGNAEVWRAKMGALVALRLICAVVATAFVFANLYAVRQSVVSLVLPRRVGNLDIGEEVERRHLTWAAAGLSALIGLGFAWSQRDWSTFLAARAGQAFGETDPYFSADLSFFVYRLPLEQQFFIWTMTVVLIVIGLVIVLYALTPSLRWERGGLYISGYVRRHLAMLAGVLLLVLSWHYRLEMYGTLSHGSAPDGAFTSLDHRVGIPANLVLSLVTLGAGLTVLWSGWTGQMRLAFAALTGVIVAVLGARQVAPFLAKRASTRDPVVRERPYEATRAGYTRRAFAVDRILTADTTLAFRTLYDAVPHVPVWDDGALRRASDRALSGANLGWFVSDSGIVAVIPTMAGAGTLATAIAASTDDQGAPPRVVRDEGLSIPPVLVVADSSARWEVFADSTDRIAAPQLVDPVARFAYALSMQNFRIWFRNLPGPSPKLVMRRGVRERVRALAPFFAQGSTVSPMWMADTLVWALHLYSASKTYPLSRRAVVAGEEQAYFHHAATALVNATTGRTLLVADSFPDPVARTWQTRFPSLFRARVGALPAAIRRQIPPARDGARAQAAAFGRYGSRDGSDVVRHLADDDGADSALAATPAPVIAFPQVGTTGYVLPLLDRSDRIRGLVIALGGTVHRTAWLPAQDSTPIWSEALDRLRAADTVSASLLVRGFVRIVPIANRIVLVQPRYDWRGGTAPRLLYVTSMVGDTVRSSRTLFQLAGRTQDTASMATGDVRARALRLYEEMRRASARGDWVAYGRAFDALGVLLRSRPDR